MKKIGEILYKQRQLGTAPHIVLLQEGFEDDIDDLIEAAKYPYVLKGPNSRAKNPEEDKHEHAKLTGSGLWILSELPIKHAASRVFKSNDCTSWDCFSNKGVMLANIEINGRLTTFLNTHMNAGGEKKNDIEREKQLVDINKFLLRYYNPADPMIFAGDFNTKPGRDSWPQLLNIIKATNIGDWCLDNDGCQISETTPEDKVVTNTVDHHLVPTQHMNQLIPVFLDRNFTEKLDNGDELSDHLGYEVHYRITQ